MAWGAQMKKSWLPIAGVFILAAALTYTSAVSQEAPGKTSAKDTTTGVATPSADANAKSKPPAVRRAAKVDPVDGKLLSPYGLAERTAMNRLDCKPNALRNGVGMHGVYRGYGQWDPELKSIEGRKQFDACVKRGLEPTPWFAFGQRGAIAMGTKFFGRGKEECLMCHSKY